MCVPQKSKTRHDEGHKPLLPILGEGWDEGVSLKSQTRRNRIGQIGADWDRQGQKYSTFPPSATPRDLSRARAACLTASILITKLWGILTCGEDTMRDEKFWQARAKGDEAYRKFWWSANPLPGAFLILVALRVVIHPFRAAFTSWRRYRRVSKIRAYIRGKDSQ